jgi:hypothetical protein
MNFTAFFLYALVRLLRPFRWMLASMMTGARGAFAHFASAANVFECFLVTGILFLINLALSIISSASKKSGTPLHGDHLETVITFACGLVLLLYLFSVYLAARRTHAHVHAAIMARQDFLEERYSLDRAIPRATYTRKAKRL